MVRGDGCRRLHDAQYKFDFCKDCSFYECELVREYTQFRENHAQVYKEQIPVTTDDGRCVGTVLGVWDKEKYDELAANSGFADVHSHSFDGAVLSYDQTKMKDVCIMKTSVCQVECGRKNVAEGIGDHYKIEIDYNGNIKEKIDDKWEPLQPVFISAQTGQGKNYFIENKLIPYVEQLNYENQKKQRILILSNRLALKQQIKKRLNGNEGLDDENEVIYSYKENVDVMTYQSLLHRKKYLKKWQKDVKKRYIYVICDEAHFFTSDAMFNPHTQKILCAITRLFRNAIRVYMSATPYECLEYIIKYENEEQIRFNRKHSEDQSQWKTGTMIFYHFKRDYGYLDVKTYSKIKELYEEIAESVNQRKEKWLIFIDDKKKCVRVKEKLEKCIEDKQYSPKVENDEVKNKVEKVYVVDTDSKSRHTYQQIVNNEKLNEDTYILISTSVLDNGVNLTGIKNIVVSDMEKAKCLQMVGRARLSKADEKKTLYIKRFGSNEANKRIKELKEQRKAYNNYEAAYGKSGNGLSSEKYSEYEFLNKYYNGKEKDWRNAKRWFGRTFKERTKLYLNEIAEAMMERRIPQYQCIFYEMEEESLKEDEQQKREIKIGQKYLEYQLSWFGREYCEGNDITFVDKEKTKKAFLDFLEPYADNEQQIDKDAKPHFRKTFTKLHDAAFGKWGPNKERIYGKKVMNETLKEKSINYKIVSNSSHWVVERCDWEIDDER